MIHLLIPNAFRYPYISHLICNAGAAFWDGVDKIGAIKHIWEHGLIHAITIPTYKLQQKGRISADGLGATWEGNIFGHYVMVRLPFSATAPE